MVLIIIKKQNIDGVEGGEIQYTLDDKHIQGSKTIENMLQCCNQYSNSSPTQPTQHEQRTKQHTKQFQQSIHLGVDVQRWNKYLNFLHEGKLSFESLEVINYLDNVNQARTWFELNYKLLCKQWDSNGNVIYPEVARLIMTNTCNKYTVFTPIDVLPFRLLDTFETMLTRITETQITHQDNKLDDKQSHYNKLLSPTMMTMNMNMNMNMTEDDTLHIVTTLYSEKIRDIYLDCNGFRSMSDILPETTSYFNNHKFILYCDKSSSREPLVAMNCSSVLHECNNNYYNHINNDVIDNKHKYVLLPENNDNDDTIALISLRIAKYYEDIKLFTLLPSGCGIMNLLYAKSSNIHNVEYQSQQSTVDVNTIIGRISYVDTHVTPHTHNAHANNHNNNVVSLPQVKMQKPVNTSYKPGVGFQTPIQLQIGIQQCHDMSPKHNNNLICHSNTKQQNYNLLTYNCPSTYGRDYYIFLPHEYDPIARIVYAFSV